MYKPRRSPLTFNNPFISKKEFEVQLALGSINIYKFYDEEQVDDSGLGDGPFYVYAVNLEQVVKVYMNAWGMSYGISAVQENGRFRCIPDSFLKKSTYFIVNI